jgi:hypothetical protein
MATLFRFHVAGKAGANERVIVREASFSPSTFAMGWIYLTPSWQIRSEKRVVRLSFY